MLSIILYIMQIEKRNARITIGKNDTTSIL